MKKVVNPQPGRITQWYVQEGEPFQPGYPLVKIELRDIQGHVSLHPQGANGVTLKKILCPVGSAVEQGQPVALIGQRTEAAPDFTLSPELLAAYSPVSVKVQASISLLRVYGPFFLALVIEALLLSSIALFLFVRAGTVPSWSWSYFHLLFSLSTPWQVLVIIGLLMLRFVPKGLWQRLRIRGERP